MVQYLREKEMQADILIDDLTDYAKDGRLTEPADGQRYEWRKMIDLVKQLGRPLTEKEAEQFRIK